MKKTLIPITVLAALLAAGTSQAALINVSYFTGSDSSTQANLSGPAGGSGTTWNIITSVDATGLLDSDGNVTTVGIDTNYSSLRRDAAEPGLLPVFESFLDVFARPNTSSVEINGLIAGELYDVWLLSYRGNNQGATNVDRSAGTWTTTNNTTSLAAQTADAQSSAPGGGSFTDGYNYVLFENVEADINGEILFTAQGTSAGTGGDPNRRLHLNGIQINQVPEPSSTALLGFGGLALVLRRRR